MSSAPDNLETDARFPSGPWLGFWIQKYLQASKHRTELRLQFAESVIAGEGLDSVGAFVIRGRYSVEDGRCHWIKRYVGKHDVFYEGFNEGKGIWGVWSIPQAGAECRGGFHIWPEGMPDPTLDRLAEEAELPLEFVEIELLGEALVP